MILDSAHVTEGLPVLVWGTEGLPVLVRGTKGAAMHLLSRGCS